MVDWSVQDVRALMERGETFAAYVFTPLCGTCQLGERMLKIALEVVNDVRVGRCDLNMERDLASLWKIESVPCLALVRGGHLAEKIYALGSVTDICAYLRSIQG